MASFEFRPAVRDQTSLLIGIAGSSGSGKTYSALRLARGLVGENGTIAMIDTEAGRGKHYAPPIDPKTGRPGPPTEKPHRTFAFNHGDMKPPFSPDAYFDAIAAADKTGYGAIIVDSMSHEWAGDGGCLDMHDAEVQKKAGDDLAKRERVNVLSWAKPKGRHKRFVGRLLQCRAHLILCLRADEKLKVGEATDPRTRKKRIEFVAAGWQPICEKHFMYEMTLSMMLTDEAPGVPKPIKLQEQHRHAFPDGAQIGEDAGRALASWAGGKAGAAEPHPQEVLESDPGSTASVASADVWFVDRNRFSDDRAFAGEIKRLLTDAAATEADVATIMNVNADGLTLLAERSPPAAVYLREMAAKRFRPVRTAEPARGKS